MTSPPSSTPSPERYPILYKIINTDEYKMYNKMYTGDENKAYAIYSFSARAYPSFAGVPAYNTAILEEVNEGKVPATVDEFVAFTQKAVEAGYSGWWPYNAKLTNWAEIDGTIAKPLGTSLRTPATYDWMWTGFVPDDESKIGTDEEHWTLMTVSDESKEVMKILAEMYANDGIHNGVGTLVDEDDGYAAFNNGTLASYGYSYGYYTQFKKLYDSWMKAHPTTGSFPISRWAPLSPTTTATGCVSMTCPPTWELTTSFPPAAPIPTACWIWWSSWPAKTARTCSSAASRA